MPTKYAACNTVSNVTAYMSTPEAVSMKQQDDRLTNALQNNKHDTVVQDCIRKKRSALRTAFFNGMNAYKQ